MAKQVINIGSRPNDKTGDAVRDAFNKVNQNFTELYTALGLDVDALNLGNFQFTGSVLSTTDDSPINIAQHLIPNGDQELDLGSADLKWRSLYLSESTLFLGDTTVSIVDGVLQIGGVAVLTENDLDTLTPTGDLRGSVYGNDSTLLVNAETSKIPWVVIENAPPIPTDISQLADSQNLLTSTSLDGYATETYVDNAVSTVTVDLTGYATETYVDNAVSSIDSLATLSLTNRVTELSSFTFVKPDNTSEIDNIDTNLSLTRLGGSGGGLINIAVESAYDASYSPAGTRWNWDGWANLDDVKNRTYTNFRAALLNSVGDEIIGAELIMHDTVNDKYYKVIFTNWSQGPAHTGAITYTRTLLDTSDPIGVAFPDGSVQTTAAKKFTGFEQTYIGDISTYTLQIKDAGNHIFAYTSTIYVPDETAVNFPLGTTVTIIAGRDVVNIQPVGGVNQAVIYRNGSSTQLSAWTISAHSSSTLIKVEPNIWHLTTDEGSQNLSLSSLSSDTVNAAAFNGPLTGNVVTTSITNANDIDIASEDDVSIITSAGDGNHEWFFNSGGYLDFPDNADLNFNGDAGIRFFTPYDPEAGTTANISIRDTDSTAELSIVNEATNGVIVVTSNIIRIGDTPDTSELFIGQHNDNNTTTTNFYGDIIFRERDIEFRGSDITFTDFGGTKSPTIDFTNATVTGLNVSASGFTYSEFGGTSEIGVTADVFDFGDGKTIDMQNSSILFTGSTISGIGDLTLSGDIRSENAINIDINLSDSTTYTWRFGEDGDLTIPGAIRTAASNIAIGNDAGETNQSISAIAIGYQAGQTNQGIGAVALGDYAGNSGQVLGAISIGSLTGALDQGVRAIAIGSIAGNTRQGQYGIGIGYGAGGYEQGDYAIAIGYQAGSADQATKSIVLNANDVGITAPESGFYVNPVRDVPGTSLLQYNSTTKEISHTNEIYSDQQISITVAGEDSTQKTWYFGNDGELTFPDGTSQSTAYPGIPTLISSGDTAPGSAVVAGETSVNFNFSGSGTLASINSAGVFSIDGGITAPANINLILTGGPAEAPGSGGVVRINGGGTSTVQIDQIAGNGVWLGKSDGTGGDVQTYSRLHIHRGVVESYEAKADATGVVEHNCDLGHLFYHTSPDANWTVNLTNLNSFNGMSTNVVLVIEQGSTPYYPNALQIDGNAQTIKWFANVTPIPQANKTEIATFTIFYNGSTYNVLGSYSSYG